MTDAPMMLPIAVARICADPDVAAWLAEISTLLADRAGREGADDLREKVALGLYHIESVHQFHGEDCLCGFSSSRSRSRTEHITMQVRALLDGEG